LKNNKTIPELEKSQKGRLYSIFVFSPILLYLSTKSNFSGVERGFLAVSAVLVAVTVGTAYLENKKKLDAIG